MFQPFPHHLPGPDRRTAANTSLQAEVLEPLLDLVADQLAARIVAELADHLSQTKPESEPWRLLDVDDVAARLGRSARWVRERAKRGQLSFVRLDGGALAFHLEDVQAFAQARRVSADEPLVLAARLQDICNPATLAGSAGRERATDPGVEA